MLEIGRLQGLRLEVRPEPVAPALEDAVAGLREALAARALRTRVISADPPPSVLADPWGLRTVLSHLLQNAVTFSPEGGEVRLRVAAEGGFVDVFVEDDGDGVAADELARLVQPFEQGRNAHGRRTEGAGLGLTICELTCRAMRAQLSLRSPPGQGFSARVRLNAA